MAKAKATKKQKSMEETLWEAANKLRGTVESSEYKHIVLAIPLPKIIPKPPPKMDLLPQCW